MKLGLIAIHLIPLLLGCGGRIAPTAPTRHCQIVRDELDTTLLLRTEEVRCGETTIVTTDDMLAVRQ